MKKLLSHIPTVFTVILCSYFALNLFLYALGYRITNDLLAFGVMSGGVLLTVASAAMHALKIEVGRTAARCASILPFAALLAAFSAANRLDVTLLALFAAPTASAAVLVCGIAFLISALVLFARYSPDKRALCTPVSLLATVFLIYGLCFFAFGGFGCETVVSETASPDGSRIAGIVDRDEGALGGSTRVFVRKRDIGVGVFRLEGIGREVYSDDYGEFKSMTLCWVDDTHLQIESRRGTELKKVG